MSTPTKVKPIWCGVAAPDRVVCACDDDPGETFDAVAVPTNLSRWPDDAWDRVAAELADALSPYGLDDDAARVALAAAITAIAREAE